MERLDNKLVEIGLANSRTRAQLMIRLGIVLVDDKVVKKNSFLVADNEIKLLKVVDFFASRGGVKLEAAIKEFGIVFLNKMVLDIGSSTGGFTDCVLRHGAKQVIAVDVGREQMVDWLRKDKRVVLHENQDVRLIELEKIKKAEIAVIDVSFISVLKLLDKLKEINLFEIVCLAKPQFECGREIAKKYRGVILDEKVRLDVVDKLVLEFSKINFYLVGSIKSPITGGDGNVEYLLYFKRMDD